MQKWQKELLLLRDTPPELSTVKMGSFSTVAYRTAGGPLSTIEGCRRVIVATRRYRNIEISNNTEVHRLISVIHRDHP